MNWNKNKNWIKLINKLYEIYKLYITIYQRNIKDISRFIYKHKTDFYENKKKINIIEANKSYTLQIKSNSIFDYVIWFFLHSPVIIHMYRTL